MTLSIHSARLPLAAFAAGAILLGAGIAMAADGLPGNASSLQETHGDWTVACQLAAAPAPAAPAGAAAAQAPAAKKICVISQRQVSPKDGAQILILQLQLADDGVSGVLDLPFGLELKDGASLQIDDAQPGQALPFKTCLRNGCIVPTTISADGVAAWRNGTKILVKTTGDDGQAESFTVSLKGFGAALDRVKALLK